MKMVRPSRTRTISATKIAHLNTEQKCGDNYYHFFSDDCKEQTVVLMLSTFSSIGQELFYLEKMWRM